MIDKVKIRLEDVKIQRDIYNPLITGLLVEYTAVMPSGHLAEGQIKISQDDHAGALMEFTLVDILEIIHNKLGGWGANE